MRKLLLLPLLCLISCESYNTPKLPSFSNDKESYGEVMNQLHLLQEKIKEIQEVDASRKL